MDTEAGIRWVFGDQLGPHFVDADTSQVLVVESTNALRRRPYHRAKAHMMLSALRHRARDSEVIYLRTPTYGEALNTLGQSVSVCDPTSYAARRYVRTRPDVTVTPSRGFVTSEAEFASWAAGRGRKRLLLEDFYRDSRRRTGVLMDEEDRPVGGTWNLDADNRLSPPKGRRTLGVPEPWWPVEDDIDAEVRDYLDRLVRDEGVRFVGRDDTRRFAVTRNEALAALDHFVAQRLPTFGPYEDAVMTADWIMSHSLLSVPLNLGLLDPLEVVAAAEKAYRRGDAPLASVEGFVRQVMGWRDYVWHIHWSQGEDYLQRNALRAHTPLPEWFRELRADDVEARCLATALREVRDHGWAHHIPRLMVLGNWALQRGYDPRELADWFHASFVDGYGWVMSANVIGMSQYADGGLMATKPYASGGAYLNRMTDACAGCRYRPGERVGERACPFTSGYWAFLDRNVDALRGNHRLAQPLAGLARLADREVVVAAERARGDAPP